MTKQEKNSLEDLNIQHLKLSDGSEIIAYINSTEKNMILVERPMLINSVHNINGQETFFFTKYMPFTEANVIVKINSSNVIATSPLDDLIKERYIRAAIHNNVNIDDDEMESVLDNTNLPEEDLLVLEPQSKCIH